MAAQISRLDHRARPWGPLRALGWKEGLACPSVPNRIHRHQGTCHSKCFWGLRCVSSEISEMAVWISRAPHLGRVCCEWLSTLLSLVTFLRLGRDPVAKATHKRRHLIGAHSTRGLEPTTILAGNMASGRQVWRWRWRRERTCN